MNVVIHVRRDDVKIYAKLFDFMHDYVLHQNFEILCNALKKYKTITKFEKMFEHDQNDDYRLKIVNVKIALYDDLKQKKIFQKNDFVFDQI